MLQNFCKQIILRIIYSNILPTISYELQYLDSLKNFCLNCFIICLWKEVFLGQYPFVSYDQIERTSQKYRRIERASDESKWDMFASRGWEKLRSPFSLASILWSLFRNKRFMLDEMTQWNASKFAIYIRKPKVAFSVFHLVLFNFSP